MAQTAGKIEKGATLPQLARIAAIFSGISWRDAILTTTNKIIPRVGASLEGFLAAIASIAASPNGVAAFPSPNRLVERFMAIFPWMSLSSQYSGNRRPITGDKHRANS